MAERSLRGTRLGALSMETDANVVPSERQHHDATSARNGHTIELPFSVEADVPPTWECRCGAEAKLGRRPRARGQAGQAPSAPTGTCCSSAAPSPSSRRSSRSAWRCCAIPRREPRRKRTA